MIKVETLLGAIQKEYNLQKKLMFIYGDLKGYPVIIKEGIENYISTLYLTITTKLSEAQVEEFKKILDDFDNEEKGKKLFYKEMKPVKLYNTYKIENYIVLKDSIQFKFMTNPAGKFKQIFFEFVDWFFKILDENNIMKSDLCPICGQEIDKDKNWFLVDYKLYHAHEKCINVLNENNDIENETAERENTGTYFNGIIGAILGSVVGSLPYIWLGYYGYYPFFVTPFICFLSKTLYDKFNGRRSINKKYILLVIVLLTVLIAEMSRVVLTVVIELKKYGSEININYVSNVVKYVIVEGKEYRFMLMNIILGSIFAVIALLVNFKNDVGELHKLKIKKLN